MFKAMKASSQELQAQLEKMDTPNRFPKVLPAKKIEWGRLQSMDLQTLYASLCIHMMQLRNGTTLSQTYVTVVCTLLTCSLNSEL